MIDLTKMILTDTMTFDEKWIDDWLYRYLSADYNTNTNTNAILDTKPNYGEAGDDLNLPSVLDGVLAKDRHFIQTALMQLKKAQFKKVQLKTMPSKVINPAVTPLVKQADDTQNPNAQTFYTHKNNHPTITNSNHLNPQNPHHKNSKTDTKTKPAIDKQKLGTKNIDTKNIDIKSFDTKNLDKQKQQLKQRIIRSNKAVQARKDSLPINLKNSLNPDLPVTAQADKIIRAIQDNQVIIVAGETGSGKTTQLPKLALLAGRGITGQIGHTQPRRLAATSVANRIAFELGEPLGRAVSFKIRFNEQGDKHSLIKLMTDGILLAELVYDRYLSNYDAIIIDEAHERSLNIDFILGYLKQLLPKRPDLKVIITSATLDTARFAEYFASNNTPAPIINVEGRSYPVEIRYRPPMEMAVLSGDDDDFDELEERLPRALMAAIDECVADSKNRPHQARDILIFAATEAQIRELAQVVSDFAPSHSEVLMLFARQSGAEQNKIFGGSNRQRIILATNIAETALTVPNIRYVIDLGFARISRYNYRSRVQRLPIEAISQAAANQRAGRCGRVADGVCIRLYSQDDFETRPAFSEPEILRTNLASVILQMAYLRLGDVASFDFITPPDLRLVNDGKKLLYELGAIKDKLTKTAIKKQRHTQTHLTDIGKTMAKMPIDPRLARMLIAGERADCLADMLIIVSALAVQDVRERPSDKQTQADQKHALFRAKDSDFLFFINVFNVLFAKHELNDFSPLSANARKSFAKKHFLSYPRIREWQKTHSQLVQMMANFGAVIDTDDKASDTASVETANLGVNDGQINASQINAKSRDKDNGNKQSFNINNAKSANLKNTNAKNTNAKNRPKSSDNLAVQYANLHRALLTALLSFVAKKSDDRNEYLMAKNQKGRIFPASVLHKKGVDWLMAFEVVQTSQVFLRINAKIEPEWIIAEAGDLLKYHYFEPHWSKKTGRVRAYAQISLFGLVIVPKQLVNYEKIDPEVARKIFIMDALVLDNLGVAMPFLDNNRRQLAKANTLEDKLRRRDLLADETSFYAFYDERLPCHITSRKALQDFIGEQTTDTFLQFDDAVLFGDKHQDAVFDDTAFPEQVQMGALSLPVSYVFDPSSDDDGVSINVPKQALAQLDPMALLWGVKGWRYELVLALLKTLPKEHRRKIVPMPDTAKQLLQVIDNQGDLLNQLSKELTRFGVYVSAQAFDSEQIDAYLKPLICVVNDKGQVIDKDRKLDKLQAKYPSDDVQSRVSGDYTSFPCDFCFVKQKNVAGALVQQFFALVPDSAYEAVDKLPINDLSQALAVHKLGVLTLIKNKLSARQKQLTAQIDKPLKLAFAPLGDLQKLKQQLIFATLQLTFDNHACRFDKSGFDKNGFDKNGVDRHLLAQQLAGDDERLLNQLPLTADEYDRCQTAVLGQFLATGQVVLGLFNEIYLLWQQIRRELLLLDTAIFAENIADMEDQLDDLQLGEFVYRVDSRYWVQYPRYLQALKTRIERLPHNLTGDTEAVYALDVPMERISGRADDKKIAPYRWLIEEYRINLFAQPMKTLSPVSPKRLEKLWHQLNVGG